MIHRYAAPAAVAASPAGEVATESGSFAPKSGATEPMARVSAVSATEAMSTAAMNVEASGHGNPNSVTTRTAAAPIAAAMAAAQKKNFQEKTSCVWTGLDQTSQALLPSTDRDGKTKRSASVRAK